MPAASLTLALYLAALTGQASQQSLPTIRGTVVDAKTSAPIADARVTLVEENVTMKTGADGRFEFARVQPRTHTLTVSNIGYIFVRRRVVAANNISIDLVVPLAEGTGTYQETVTVAADAAAARPTALGVSSQMQLGSAGLADLRGVAADDPMRAIQALPGVATGNDFQAEFSVRGSAFRHVGVVMDETPTQLLLHAIRGTAESGSVAMINTDILRGASLMAGAHPRQHGDWLGATLDFDVRDGSRDRFGVRAAVSGTSASAVLEGPLGASRRGSWLVSIRRSYLDWLVRKVAPEVDSTIGFLDAQAKVVFDLTSRQQLQYLMVAGDAKYHQDETSIANGLLTARSQSIMHTVSWRYAHPRAIVSTRASSLTNDFLNTGVVGQHLAEGGSRLYVMRADAIVPLARGWTFESGLRREWLETNETLRTFQNTSQGVRLRFERSISAAPATSAGWAHLTWRTDKTGLGIGLRATDRSAGTASAVLPWALAEHTFGRTTVRAGIGRAAQFIDPLIIAVSPVDRAPERALSYDLGLEQPLGKGIHIQAAGFYRSERHVMRLAGEDRVDPVTGARIPQTTFPVFSPTLSGTTQGVDLLVIRRSTTGLSGWIGYTWAHTRYHDELTGENFDGDFDQRHTLNVFAQQRLSYRMTVSAKLRIGSNFPLVGYFQGTTDALRLSAVRNQVRLPTYARLDIRANRTFTFQRYRLTLFVEVMNLFGRTNLRQTDGSIGFNLAANGFTDRLLPRVPSAGLLFEF